MAHLTYAPPQWRAPRNTVPHQNPTTYTTVTATTLPKADNLRQTLHIHNTLHKNPMTPSIQPEQKPTKSKITENPIKMTMPPTMTTGRTMPAQPTTKPPDLNPIQSKYPLAPRIRMLPDSSIQHHPAYETLMSYATAGCPVDCGPAWSREHIEAAIQHGPHASATTPEAAASIRAEAQEKVAQGYARITRWDDIKDNPPHNLKISPIAAVPHKSRLFRTVLDLSFRLRLQGFHRTSVNETTTAKSNHKSMEQMGQVLWHIITMIAKANPNNGPIVMAKWDIKDGFWRLTVSPEDAWHFCYVLPRLQDSDPIELAVSTCLQMGWTESPPIFCTATETARDVGQENLNNEHTLPPHKLEHMCLPAHLPLPHTDDVNTENLAKLLEVYVDDFMGFMQAPTNAALIHFTRAILHGIHSVFPPPGPKDDPMDEPISLKKLQQGDGIWDTRKEILGWLFDGVTRCMQLPPDKTNKITNQLKQILRKTHVRFGDLEKINGKLMHASTGIPNGRGLLSPIIATLATKPNTKHYKDRETRLNTATRQAITDWLTLLPLATKLPMPCRDLIQAPADFGGYCDASKHGAGGVWFGIHKKLPPIVWRVEFPLQIQEQVVSATNPHGKITNLDLKMTGLLLQWIVLEQFADLAHTHVACWCDNTPTVAWATKLLATKATNAARLL